jgi:uncharacterized BrkB/YihY/UPF0761 family membrane protein
MVGALPAHGALPDADRGACVRLGGRGQRAFGLLSVSDGDAVVLPRHPSLARCDAGHLPGLGDFFSGEPGEFLVRNLQPWMVPQLHIASMFLLLFTANGIFEPLDVALNRAWGVTHNRTYLKNQLISLGLIFACGGLALLSLMLTALNGRWITDVWGKHATAGVWINLLVFKLAALPVSILALFLVYWLLPNRQIEPRRVVPVAITVGLALEFLKYVNLLISPLLTEKLKHEYEIFRFSVTILIWSFASAMIVLAGAHWTARQDSRSAIVEES